MKEKVTKVLRFLVQGLVQGNFDTIYQNDKNKVISVTEIKEIIAEYVENNGKLTLPDDIAFSQSECIEACDSDEVFVEFDLWVEGKQSDLTLCVTVFPDESYSISDIHVM